MSEMITKKHSYFRGNKIDSDDGCIKSVNILKIIKLSDLNWWAVLSHKKEPIWLSSNEVDEPRAYFTEWSKSERERQTSYINAYIWNLERWYWGTYLQGSNRDTDIENRLVDMGRDGGGEGGTNWDSSTETCTLPYVKLDSQWKFAIWCRELKSGALWQPRRVGWGRGWEGGWRGRRHIYTPMANSCWCMAETNIIL